MATANQLNHGMTITVGGKLYRVESAVKVTVPKGSAFIKAKLRDIESGELVEKNFKPNQEIEEGALQERRLEFLYPEKDYFVFLDVGSLEQVQIPADVVGAKINYLKEGVEVRASMSGQTVFSVELPQFLELMVVAESERQGGSGPNSKRAQLETGAWVEVSPSVGVGDTIRIDDRGQFIQRV